jgi:hypothetical protein
LVAGTAVAPAAGVSEKTPGNQMQLKKSAKKTTGAQTPGASAYSPGHRMQAKGSLPRHPGASGYAPGHSTTTGSGTMR